MHRRQFLFREGPTTVLGLGAALGVSSFSRAQGSNATGPSYFECFFLRVQSGSQVSRMLGWLEKRALPVFLKYGFAPAGFFTVEVGPTMPAVFGFVPAPSLAELEVNWKKVDADPEYATALAELEKDEPTFYREDSMLLRATPFSPPLKAAAAGDPAHKIFELRIYEAPTHRQLGLLHDRFAGGEIEIFHKSGIHPVLYADTVVGPNQPNMIYLIPFESEAQREKAWATFRADPDWQRIRAESVRRGGEIVRNITNMILTPASFSMIR